MRPRGENIDYDKLRARYEALAAELRKEKLELQQVMAELAEEKQEMEGAYALSSRQADLLTGVVNAIKGDPPPDTLWSHHDAAELARKVMTELRGRGKPRDGTTHAEGCHTWGPAHYECALQYIGGLQALLKGINDTDNDRVAPAEFNVACACGHAPEEHGHVPGYPGSTACTVEGCDCIAYERGE